ncbi:hypothetical protein P3601_25075, partial [Vibrio parahaemolyticus]
SLFVLLFPKSGLDVDKFKLDCANYAGGSLMNIMFANQVTIMKPGFDGIWFSDGCVLMLLPR